MPAADNLSTPSELLHLCNVENPQLGDLKKVVQIQNAVIQSQNVQIGCLHQEIGMLRKELQDQGVALAALYSVCAIPSAVFGSPDLPREDVEREEEIFFAIDKSVVEKIVYEIQPVDKNGAALSTETQPAPKKTVYEVPNNAEQADSTGCNDNIISSEDGSFDITFQPGQANLPSRTPSQKPFFDLSVERYVSMIIGTTTFPLLFMCPLLWQLLVALVRAGSKGLNAVELLNQVEVWRKKYQTTEGGTEGEEKRLLSNETIQRGLSRLNVFFSRM